MEKNKVQLQMDLELKIKIPEVKQLATIAHDSKVTVKDLIKTLVSKSGLKNVDEYGLFSTADGVFLPGDKLISTLKIDLKVPLVLQRKNLIHLKIKVNGSEVFVNLKKEATVKEAMEMVKSMSGIANVQTFGLFLVGDKKYGDAGTLMEESKPIRSYKLKTSVHDILLHY